MSENVTKRNTSTGQVELVRTAGVIPPSFVSLSNDLAIDSNRQLGLSTATSQKLSELEDDVDEITEELSTLLAWKKLAFSSDNWLTAYANAKIEFRIAITRTDTTTRETFVINIPKDDISSEAKFYQMGDAYNSSSLTHGQVALSTSYGSNLGLYVNGTSVSCNGTIYYR